MKLSLNLSEDNSPFWLDTEVTSKLQRIAGSLDELLSPVDVILVDDRYIQKINRDFRGFDRATDVISFSYLSDVESHRAEDDVAGEIYVSYETLEREASVQGVDVKNLFLRIGVHGMLHILGFEHESDVDAEQMETEERRLLSSEMTASELDELF